MSAAPTNSPMHKIIARSTVFCNSRTSPGQAYAASLSSAAGVKFLTTLPVLAANPCRKCRATSLGVVEVLAQGIDDDFDDMQSKVKVLAKRPSFDRPFEVTVRRRDDSHVDLNGRVAPHPFKGMAFEHSQKFGLNPRSSPRLRRERSSPYGPVRTCRSCGSWPP